MSANGEGDGGLAEQQLIGGNGAVQVEQQPIGHMRMLRMVDLNATDVARQNLQRAIDRSIEDVPTLRDQINDHRLLVGPATQELTDALEDGSREVCQQRLDAIKEFERARDRALDDYLELKQTRADAEAQLAELNRTTQDRAAWRRDRDNLAMRLRGGERRQMAVLLSNAQVVELFKRFRRASDQGSELHSIAVKFTAGLSHFSGLKVLARIAYYDDLAKVKQEAVAVNVLNDQQRTLVSLRQGIRVRTAAGMKEREEMIASDIENRIAVFMLVVAEETGNLPNDFDHWAEDPGDQPQSPQSPQSPRGAKRKRGDIYAAVSRTLTTENAGYGSSFKPGNIKEMATQGKVIYSLLKPYGRHWRTVLPLADFCREVDSSAHNSVLKVQPYIWKALKLALQMADGLHAWLKDICRDPEAWKQSHPVEMANARAAYYRPGSDAAWGYGVDNGRRVCNWFAEPGNNHRLRVSQHDAVSVVRRLEPSAGMKPSFLISTWTMAMKLICVHEITRLKIKTTPEHPQNEYWVFEWLKTCPSTRDLPPDEKRENQRIWIDSDNASVGVLEDTPNSCFALAVFEKGGKVNNANTVHILSHFTPLGMEYPQRAEHWAAIIRRMFPADYPVLAADVQVHSPVPGRLPATVGHRQLYSGIMTVMDFVHLSLTGEQYPINERIDYGVCFRTLVSEVARMAAGARQHNLGARQWDAGLGQPVHGAVVGQGGSAGLHQPSG